MYHKPVFLKESVDGLVWKPDGTYVDLTFGGGGHSAAILERLKGGRLFAFDQDQDAAANAEGMDLTFIQANFRHLKRYLKLYKVSAVDGILADLGVSSHQFDVPDRGFSTRFDAELDMRMDQQAKRTAKEVVNTYSERDLHQLLGMYGEVKNARTLAQAIVAARTNKSLETVEDLKQVLSKFAAKGREAKYYAQVFQALRLEVNDEIKALEEMLEQSVELLAPGGRLVVLSYHSLEDRLVKHMINKGKLYGEVEKDFYGNVHLPLKAITKKPMIPSQEEIMENSRARSAKLRIAEKQ
ncbi:16S rRNA (cytosine(1402)-N(4))-methyltransferase RsmH [Catalinimonas niigatensis]|uniref:16S rRNA (cytosine(1402)-N(4))-methyltransferase RsmH n=1 Tax=Catalinimonas niigatensis TaxID=1397264 RepID=UPI0026656718|nr:16S rRNA (cytosine(1402)-N(4))-methyltransferase RsmH [Catalinimonas niigatensis]WPP53181.1 16S rRNA (cytosine(1402)-N(4))-methyltransferase RsmH [Catalinimonas niigatensis]